MPTYEPPPGVEVLNVDAPTYERETMLFTVNDDPRVLVAVKPKTAILMNLVANLDTTDVIGMVGLVNEFVDQALDKTDGTEPPDYDEDAYADWTKAQLRADLDARGITSGGSDTNGELRSTLLAAGRLAADEYDVLAYASSAEYVTMRLNDPTDDWDTETLLPIIQLLTERWFKDPAGARPTKQPRDYARRSSTSGRASTGTARSSRSTRSS